MPLGLILKLAAQLIESYVRNRLGQVMIAHHPRYIQVLDCDDCGVFVHDDVVAHVMQDMLANVCNAGVLALDLGLSFAPVRPAFRATIKFTLQPTQLALRFPQCVWIFVYCTV